MAKVLKEDMKVFAGLRLTNAIQPNLANDLKTLESPIEINAIYDDALYQKASTSTLKSIYLQSRVFFKNVEVCHDACQRSVLQ